MFMAFSAALCSADLSRQVGAIIARNEEIIATGANDSPRYKGGQYWPFFDPSSEEIIDFPEGRDYTRGYDSNKKEQQKIIDNIIENIHTHLPDIEENALRDALKKSSIKDITEYGRVVHAEMSALMTCTRNAISSAGATLYCTTFPCHNCAKHIIAAGIQKVIFIEPYPKSKALELHNDAAVEVMDGNVEKVIFQPFVGVGPRKYFDLFSINLSSGYEIRRKKKNGKVKRWGRENGVLRLQLDGANYIDRETLAYYQFAEFRGEE